MGLVSKNLNGSTMLLASMIDSHYNYKYFFFKTSRMYKHNFKLIFDHQKTWYLIFTLSNYLLSKDIKTRQGRRQA